MMSTLKIQANVALPRGNMRPTQEDGDELGRVPVVEGRTARHEACPAGEDENLLDRLCLGEERAFDELVERYHLPVYHLAYRLTQNQADAEDLTQEVFLRAYRGLVGFRRASAVKTWLFQIAINTWRDAQRRFHPLPESFPASVQDKDALAWLERKELQTQIQGAIARLPEKQRAACILRLLHELSFKEIGEVLGSPIATVKTNYRLAVMRLRGLLRDVPAGWGHSPLGGD